MGNRGCDWVCGKEERERERGIIICTAYSDWRLEWCGVVWCGVASRKKKVGFDWGMEEGFGREEGGDHLPFHVSRNVSTASAPHPQYGRSLLFFLPPAHLTPVLPLSLCFAIRACHALSFLSLSSPINIQFYHNSQASRNFHGISRNFTFLLLLFMWLIVICMVDNKASS